MHARLQIKLAPFHPDQSARLAAKAWAVLKREGFTDHATHFALGYRSRGTPIAKLGDPFVDGNESVTVFDGSSRHGSTLRVWLKFRLELEVDLTWDTAPDDLFDRCEALSVALDAALGDQGWFVFSDLSTQLPDGNLRPDPPRWHRWLHGVRMLDIFDTRLPGVVDTLREIPLPDGVTWRQAGHFVFVRWCSSPNAGDLAERLRDREQFLAETFAWGLESVGGFPPVTPAHVTLPFPDASNTRHLDPEDVLPWAVGELVKSVRRRHHRKAARLLAALSEEHIREAFGPMCHLGHRPTIDALLAAGAEVGHIGVQGWSPLMLASLGRNVEIVTLLLERGASAATQGGRDRVTALHVAAGVNSAEWTEKMKGRSNAALLADLRDRSLRIVALLIEAGAPLNAQDRNGRTAFSLAASDGRFALAESLIQAGADPMLRDAEAASALELLAVRGSITELSELLTIYGERLGARAR